MKPPSQGEKKKKQDSTLSAKKKNPKVNQPALWVSPTVCLFFLEHLFSLHLPAHYGSSRRRVCRAKVIPACPPAPLSPSHWSYLAGGAGPVGGCHRGPLLNEEGGWGWGWGWLLCSTVQCGHQTTTALILALNVPLCHVSIAALMFLPSERQRYQRDTLGKDTSMEHRDMLSQK